MMLSACTEARYAAHLAKQIPMPGDTPQSQGTFKVGNPYRIQGKQYFPRESYSYDQTGIASWYGPGFHGKRTANGEYFDQNELTAAHKTLQMPSLVRVTNLENGRSLILRVNDRGPYAHGREIDVSKRAAELLGFRSKGTAKVRVQVLDQESRKIAQAAKSGQDTRGYEVALNQNRVPRTPPVQKTIPVQQSQTVTVASNTHTTVGAVQGHPAPDGRFMPDPVVSLTPVTPSNIYIQAGSFSVENNAMQLARQLENIGPTKVSLAQVNNRPFYRVRLGPYAETVQADAALNSLIASGKTDARIIVD